MLNFICAKCKAKQHGKCSGKNSCDCQHKSGKGLIIGDNDG